MVRWLLSGSTPAVLIAPILGATIALSSISASAVLADCPDPPVIHEQPRSWVRGYEQPVTFSFRLTSSPPELQEGDFTWFKDGSEVTFGDIQLTTIGDTVTAALHLLHPRFEHSGVYQVRVIHRCQTGPLIRDTVVTDTFRLTVLALQTPPPLVVVWPPSTQVTVPAALALDDSENVFVAREDEREIQKFDRNGRLVLSWTLNGTGPSGSGITFDNQGVHLKPFAMRYAWPEQLDESAADLAGTGDRRCVAARAQLDVVCRHDTRDEYPQRLASPLKRGCGGGSCAT